MESLVSENCYGNKSYTMLEAEQCDEFHFKHDYKLNLVNSFWNDHVSKHLLSYNQCYENTKDIGTVAEKDRSFAECHKDWLKDFSDVKSWELEGRARKLLGKGFD